MSILSRLTCLIPPQKIWAASTWSDEDVSLDEWALVESGDFTKAFEAGFPTLDFTTLESTIRCRVTTVQANGYPINEFGVFNADSTEKLESRDTFTQISKTDTDELIFVSKTLVE